jgi:hypothetical protein
MRRFVARSWTLVDLRTIVSLIGSGSRFKMTVWCFVLGSAQYSEEVLNPCQAQRGEARVVIEKCVYPLRESQSVKILMRIDRLGDGILTDIVRLVQ